MMIYVSHPYSGLEENKQKVEKIIEELCDTFPDDTFVSPIHCFGFTYHTVEYDLGMRYCLDLLDVCDSMMVFGDWQNSKGCSWEVRHAQEKGIPYEVMEGEL